MNRSGNECYVALHHICLNEVIVNQFLPDDFELSLQLLDLLFANLRVEIPVALANSNWKGIFFRSKVAWVRVAHIQKPSRPSLYCALSRA